MYQFNQGDFVIYDPPYEVLNSAWIRRIGKVFVVLEDQSPADVNVTIAGEKWAGFFKNDVPYEHRHTIRKEALVMHRPLNPDWEL
jgi:hypothetical protein